jgi:hypothetical protein
VLDRTANLTSVAEAAPGERQRVARRSPLRRAMDGLRRGFRMLDRQASSSLTRRIVLLNIAGLAVW